MSEVYVNEPVKVEESLDNIPNKIVLTLNSFFGLRLRDCTVNNDRRLDFKTPKYVLIELSVLNPFLLPDNPLIAS